MEDEKKTQELPEKDLNEVAGGYTYYVSNGTYYRFTGDSTQENLKYLCPKCGRPLYKGSGFRYYCDPCNDSWFFERGLKPNMDSGLWEIV